MARKEKNPSSMKTAFIRVTAVNNTSDGLVEYSKDNICKTMTEWSNKCSMTYWLIEHGADDEETTTHFHIVIRFGSPTPFANVKSKFPYGQIVPAKNIKNCVQYLVHANDLSKIQYNWEDVVTNCQDMSPFKVQSNIQGEIGLQSVIDRIEKGEIREYNQFDLIDINTFSKYRSRIENALLYYREKIYMDKNRKIEVVFMSGETGSGKTSFAKEYCQKANKSYCISSSSNDPMQDYKGEDVLILDDLRDSDFKFTDLLKILDNHTKTTMRARYHNKAFIGETIIITSYKRLADWYHDIERENKEQLYRRIKTQYQFEDDYINIFGYDEGKHKYMPLGRTKNLIKLTSREKVNMGIDMLKAMGLEMDIEYEEDLKRRLDNMSDRQLDDVWEAAESNPFGNHDAAEFEKEIKLQLDCDFSL